MSSVRVYSANSRSICPHCGNGAWLVAVEKVEKDASSNIVTGKLLGKNTITPIDANYPALWWTQCIICSKYIIQIKIDGTKAWQLIHPRSIQRPEISEHVPENIKSDYGEAVSVLPLSPKSSAAMSRRCLEHILDNQSIAVDERNLKTRLKKAEESLSAELIEFAELIRKFAIIGVHVKTYTVDDEGKEVEGSDSLPVIADVEPHEAEILLEFLDELFENYFVKPKKRKAIIESAKEKTAAVADLH